jgi:hypothetical protein
MEPTECQGPRTVPTVVAEVRAKRFPQHLGNVLAHGGVPPLPPHREGGKPGPATPQSPAPIARAPSWRKWCHAPAGPCKASYRHVMAGKPSFRIGIPKQEFGNEMKHVSQSFSQHLSQIPFDRSSPSDRS